MFVKHHWVAPFYDCNQPQIQPRERERAESNWKLFCGAGVIYFNLLEMDFSNRVEEMLYLEIVCLRMIYLGAIEINSPSFAPIDRPLTTGSLHLHWPIRDKWGDDWPMRSQQLSLTLGLVYIGAGAGGGVNLSSGQGDWEGGRNCFWHWKNIEQSCLQGVNPIISYLLIQHRQRHHFCLQSAVTFIELCM